ncbi:hypothetical protein BpJC7_06370 [Weizmannia acidilactici]|uniref:DUF2768 domain-containing protein n=1 Tax=Weizmannia acidilactici TaxID=2607726 RepID=A0A5J4JK44_9BACI|nr:hypothetical protein BpJC7_06370 [Weizmannia acidilactici]
MQRGGVILSRGMANMWISLFGMGLFFLAMVMIMASRYKLKSSVMKWAAAALAYACLAVGGLIMAYIVLSGPAN